MAYAKVPPDHVHIVALFDGEVGFAAATNTFYRNAFKADNPNLTIVHALKKAGVNCWFAARPWPKQSAGQRGESGCHHHPVGFDRCGGVRSERLYLHAVVSAH